MYKFSSSATSSNLFQETDTSTASQLVLHLMECQLPAYADGGADADGD